MCEETRGEREGWRPQTKDGELVTVDRDSSAREGVDHVQNKKCVQSNSSATSLKAHSATLQLMHEN